MRVLLTGATGFIGSALLVELLKSPVVDRIICLSRRPTCHRCVPADGRVLWIYGDVKEDDWHARVPRADVLIHAAANAAFGNDASHDAENYQGTVQLLKWAASAAVRHIVFISTIGAVDREAKDRVVTPLGPDAVPAPRTRYGRAKLRAEHAVQASGIPWTVVRPAWVYGKGMRRGSHLSVLASMVRRRSAGSIFRWPGRVSVVHVEDLCRGVSTIATKGQCIGQVIYAACESIGLGAVLATFGAEYGVGFAGAVPIPATLGRIIVSRLHRVMPLTMANLFVDYLTCETRPFVDLITPNKPLLFANRYKDVLRTIDPLWKTWLVTGAGSGIGQALASLLVTRGVRVIGVDRCFSSETSESVQRVCLDLASPEAVGILSDIVGTDDVGVVVNNAGVGFKRSFADLQPELLAATCDVNMLFPMRLTHELIPLLSQRRGTVVNVSSSMAGVPLPGMSLYSASKGFVQSWSIGLAEELRGRLQVVTIAPTGTNTGFQRKAGVKGGQRSLLSPEVVAQATLDAVINEKSFAFVGKWPMRLALLAGSVLPLPIQARVWGKLFGDLR